MFFKFGNVCHVISEYTKNYVLYMIINVVKSYIDIGKFTVYAITQLWFNIM